MSNHDSIRNQIPKVVSLTEAPMSGLGDKEVKKELLIAGQGCLTFTLDKGTEKAELIFSIPKSDSGEIPTDVEDAAFVLSIDKECATFNKRDANGETTPMIPFLGSVTRPDVPDGYSLGIDQDVNCVYWVSIDNINKKLSYGKGEMRLSTTLQICKYDTPRNIFTKKEKTDRYPFIGYLKDIKKSIGVNLSHVWIDPVTTEPPSLVIPSNQYTMENAANNEDAYVTPSNLSVECQHLYGNVAGNRFGLEMDDFPDFGQAIEYSVRTEGCLGYRIIKHKLDNNEFSNEDSHNIAKADDEYKEVYLRITLGTAQGESPGIPYVLEIWPPGCGSPIHHHGYTHAIIKVLRGAIDVDLYRMLPQNGNPTKALKKVTFNKGDVTYLMPHANQFHRLRNDIQNSETCITIQCYSYAKDDQVHYPTFDYIEDNKLGHFEPISDYDFVAFKEEIRKEWNEYLIKNRFWSTYEPKQSEG